MRSPINLFAKLTYLVKPRHEKRDTSLQAVRRQRLGGSREGQRDSDSLQRSAWVEHQWLGQDVRRCLVAHTRRLLQEHDDVGRSPHLAGHIPCQDAKRPRGVPEAANVRSMPPTSILPTSPRCGGSSTSISDKLLNCSAVASMRFHAMRMARPSRHWHWSSCSGCWIATQTCSTRSRPPDE